MKPCPKCESAGRWAGPRWEPERWADHEDQSIKLSGERLRYECCVCGYVACTPCKDAAEKKEAVA